MPRSDHIDEILHFISVLLEQGQAYRTSDGSVYFSIESYLKCGFVYPKLRPAQTPTAADSDSEKRDTRDFALWKGAKPGEPWWQAPWGSGRPGWHIECSAMSIISIVAISEVGFMLFSSICIRRASTRSALWWS